MKYRLAATALCLLAGLGCTRATQPERMPPRPEDARPGVVRAEEGKTLTSLTEVVKADNDFGFRLFRELYGGAPTGNLFISPTSIALALGMTWNGALEETRQQMAEVLGLGTAQPGNMSMGAAALLEMLQSADPKVTLEVANAIWARRGIPLAEKFAETSRLYYQAEVGELDFSSPDAVRTINGWVSAKTQGKIETLFDRLNAEDVIVLANAVYFKGSWTEAFEKEKTWDQAFFRADGSEKKHPMMRQGGEYRYFEGEGLQAISLPYGAERFEMLVLLPEQEAETYEEFPLDEGDEPGSYDVPESPGAALTRLVGQLTPENLDRWLGLMRTRDGNVVLPRFKHDYAQTLNKPLTALGMGIAFDPERANFDGMLPAPVDMPFYISEVLHKTFVEVNEEGTEAAAVTGVKMAMTAMPRQQDRFQMVCDHPFVYLIRDRESGTVLFIGTVLDPKV